MEARETSIIILLSSSSNIEGGKVRSISDDKYVLILLPHVYVYHTCTRHILHISSPVANRSIVDLGATVQKNKAILVMHALSGADTVTATYNVGKQLAMKQPIHTICPFAGDSQADLDEICSSAMWMRKVCICSLIDSTVFCVCEAGSSCLKQLNKISCRR